MGLTTEKKKDSVFQNGTEKQKLEKLETKKRQLETYITAE